MGAGSDPVPVKLLSQKLRKGADSKKADKQEFGEVFAGLLLPIVAVLLGRLYLSSGS